MGNYITFRSEAFNYILSGKKRIELSLWMANRSKDTANMLASAIRKICRPENVNGDQANDTWTMVYWLVHVVNCESGQRQDTNEQRR